MISIYKILKEVITPTQEYQELVDNIVDQGGEFLGSGDYGAAFLVGDRVLKVTTDSEELEDAQKIKGKKTKYFVYIYDVEVINPNLGIITMDNLEPYTADPDTIPIDDIYDEADNLGISPDLEGPGGSIKMDNIMQDRYYGNVKVIDV
jgi:hypothetical protein